MADGSVLMVVIKGISLVEPLEYLGQGRLPSLNQKVDVVPHEDIGVEKEPVAILIDSEELEIFLIIRGISEYFLSLVAAGNDVIECTLIFDAGFACHNERLTKGRG